ncbi:hypothetical protein NM688_g217 [Phlebia brevispora]|uniref:Uncharacterized protein n=1 Tax=Phlebia brevispora TaxID=194682 RepID=A0ACC1TEY0_9APHY|nr:hypothetical protein NM688_g217 [Phlebia brevispora]
MTGGFSALPVAEDGGAQNDGVHLAGTSKILGPKFLQLPVLSIGLLGVQVLWSVEMSYGTPYLISLGLSKSAVAMVFLAGPISGLVVQPLIGVLADNSKSRFGRRRPYMLGGVAICTAGMLLLGFTRPFASIFTRPGSIACDILTIWLAIVAIFSIDFSINAVQAVDRALLVDILPPSEQPDGNAWAARMLGIGSVAGYFVGNVDMTKILPFLGDTELEVLSVVGAFLLVLTHGATAYCTKEKVVVENNRSEKGFRKEIKDLWQCARTLPSVIMQICIIQFFAWVGWFPVLFNTTEFIAELHRRAHPDADSNVVFEEGTRLGSRAMFYSSILSLVANIIMPFFVAEAASRKHMQDRLSAKPKSIWVRWFNKLKVHLASLWAASHLLFAVCMFATFFYSGVVGATIFTTLTGYSWAITQWAPFTLLAEAILSEEAEAEDASSILLDDTRSHRNTVTEEEGQDHERQFLVGDAEDEELEDEVRSFRSSASMDDEPERGKLDALMHNAAARTSYLNVSHGAGPSHDAEDDSGRTPRRGGGLAAKAGTIMGIHNIFVVIPQFLITGISSVIFAIMSPRLPEPQYSDDTPVNSTQLMSDSMVSDLRLREGPSAQGSGPNSYAVVFRLGGIAAAVAFVLTVRLARHLRQL